MAEVNCEAIAQLLAAAEQQKCPRLVRVTGKDRDPWSITSILINALGSMAKAWNFEGERRLRGANIDYTIVRPGFMGDVDATLDEDKALALADNGGDLKAIRLQCRLTQQRVMLAWLMMSKLRPTAEKPGTFIVKSLPEPQARLALPPPGWTGRPDCDVDVHQNQVSESAAAAAAWLQASEAPSPSRFRVTTSPTRASERYTLASKAATNDGDYRQLLEHHRREIREQREAARRSSPERVQQWGVWAK
eukprot:g21494.t1